MKLFLLTLLPLGCATFMTAAPARIEPDLVVINASVHTMNPKQPMAEAIAVLRNRIVAVGASPQMKDLAASGTKVIDAKGKLLLPGFNDAHVHFLMGGFSLSNVDLRDAASPEEMAARLAAYARKIPAGQWILGGDWDHEKWPGAPLPTRQMIDAATPHNPVFINRLDGHMALANSTALKAAAITRETKDPDGGLIVRDAQGEPTGIVKDAAEELVERVIPAKSFEQKHAAARAATEYAAKLGVTSVTDMSAGDDANLYQYMAQRGELKTRIYAARSIVSWEVLGQAGVRGGFGNDMVRMGALKGFADGSLGSTTALFFQPYNDAPNTRGLLFDQMIPEGIMLKRVLAADKAGLHVMIHAIGDEANARILDIYQKTEDANGARDRRFRIEHAQHLRAADIPRFGQHGVIASMQPYHAADDGRWCEKRIGPERSRTTYAFRSLLDSGAVLAFGSDWTVAPLNPLLGIKAAVTRQTLDGKHPGGWVPEQKISVDEAVRAFTMGSAYAEFADQAKGSLETGKVADFVLLDRDIYRTNPTEIDSARVVLTVLGGQVVFNALPE
jgi:predicted amidohydrolase YtcJ